MVEDYYEEFEERMDTIKKMVGQILREHPMTRNDDRLLWLMSELKFGNGITCNHCGKKITWIESSDWKKWFSSETISRCRRKFNERGAFLPTDPKVAEARGLNEELYREYFRSSQEKYEENYAEFKHLFP